MGPSGPEGEEDPKVIRGRMKLRMGATGVPGVVIRAPGPAGTAGAATSDGVVTDGSAYRDRYAGPLDLMSQTASGSVQIQSVTVG